MAKRSYADVYEAIQKEFMPEEMTEGNLISWLYPAGELGKHEIKWGTNKSGKQRTKIVKSPPASRGTKTLARGLSQSKVTYDDVRSSREDNDDLIRLKVKLKREGIYKKGGVDLDKHIRIISDNIEGYLDGNFKYVIKGSNLSREAKRELQDDIDTYKTEGGVGRLEDDIAGRILEEEINLKISSFERVTSKSLSQSNSPEEARNILRAKRDEWEVIEEEDPARWKNIERSLKGWETRKTKDLQTAFTNLF